MLKNYIKRILVFSSLIFAIAYLIFYFAIPQFYINIFPFLLLFFVSISILAHVILTKAGKEKITRFSTFYIGSITVRLFIYTIFLIIYILADRDHAITFLISFLILYFLFTFFETYSLLKDLKQQDSLKN